MKRGMVCLFLILFCFVNPAASLLRLPQHNPCKVVQPSQNDGWKQADNPVWVETYQDQMDERFYSVVECLGDGFAATGTRGSGWGSSGTTTRFLRLTSTGVVDTRNGFFWHSEHQSYQKSLVTCDDGSYLMAGFAYMGSYGRNFDATLTNINSLGSVNWSRTYGGIHRDVAYGLAECGTGGYALTGATESSGSGGSDFWLVRVEENGTLMWAATYGGSDDEEARAITSCETGGFAIAGTTSTFGAGGTDYWLVRTDDYGGLLWQRTFGGPHEETCSGLVECSDGGFALIGQTASYGAGSIDAWMVRVNADGVLLWEKTFGGTDNDYCTQVVECSTGGFIVCGGTQSAGAGGEDIWVLRLDSEGNVMWEFTYGYDGDDSALAVIECRGGGFLLSCIAHPYATDDFYPLFIRMLDTEPTSPSSPTQGLILDSVSLHLLLVILSCVVILLVGYILISRIQRRENGLDAATDHKEEGSTPGDLTPPAELHCMGCGAAITTHPKHCTECKGELVRCMICNQFIKPKEKYAKCPHCGGVGHRRHLLEWLKTNGKCPICRRKLQPSKLK